MDYYISTLETLKAQQKLFKDFLLDYTTDLGVKPHDERGRELILQQKNLLEKQLKIVEEMIERIQAEMEPVHEEKTMESKKITMSKEKDIALEFMLTELEAVNLKRINLELHFNTESFKHSEERVKNLLKRKHETVLSYISIMKEMIENHKKEYEENLFGTTITIDYGSFVERVLIRDVKDDSVVADYDFFRKPITKEYSFFDFELLTGVRVKTLKVDGEK